jgi:hypothetical protein
MAVCARGAGVLMNPDDDTRDGMLFRLWIKMATVRPSRVAVALARCLTEDDYREALLKLAREERINLP